MGAFIMKLIKIIKPKTNKCSICKIELEVSASYFNVPAMKIDVVQEINISDLSTEIFDTEEQDSKSRLAQNKWSYGL